MTKKIEHLRSELQDFFPEEKNQKLTQHLQELSELQEDFSGTKNFKSQLKNRLNNIYTLEHTTSFSLRSLFRYMGIFASFLFISGASYFYYTLQQNTGENFIVPDILQIQEISISDQKEGENENLDTPVTPSESFSQDVGISQNTSNLPASSLQNVGDIQTPKIQKPSPVSDTKSPDTSSNQKIQDEEISNSFKSIPESDDQNALKNTISPASTQADAIMQDQEPENTAVTDEYIIPQILNTLMQEDTGEEVPSDQNIPTSHIMQKSRMMIPSEDIFGDLCTSYSGSLSDDMQECIFVSGESCTYESMLGENGKTCKFLEKKEDTQK